MGVSLEMEKIVRLNQVTKNVRLKNGKNDKWRWSIDQTSVYTFWSTYKSL